VNTRLGDNHYFRLGVRGCVRLSIKKPLAFDATQQSGGTVLVVIAERFAMIEFEIRLSEIAVKVSLADAVELTVDRPFEQSEETFDRVGVVKPASSNIFIG
jgi:hypothetical protein